MKFWWIGQPVVPGSVHGALPGLAEVVEAVGVVAAAECSRPVDHTTVASLPWLLSDVLSCGSWWIEQGRAC